jgi:hypothetical protein
MKISKIFVMLLISMVLASRVYAAYPYSMTYTVSAGDTILADHLNTSNTEHINNNIPEAIDDYSTNAAEMQATTDPYPASSASLATTLDGELQRIRYQLDAIIGDTYWYEDPPTYCENSASFDHGTFTYTTGGQIVLDVDGSGTNTSGSINFGVDKDAAIYWDGSDLYGTSTGDITFNSADEIILLDDTGIGTSTVTMQLDVFDTSGAQLRLGYDSGNYIDFEVNSTGTQTATIKGTYPAIDFEDQVVRKPVFEDYSEKIVTINNADGTTDLDMELANNFWINIDEDITITVSNTPASGNLVPLTIWLVQDNLGTSTVSWTNFVWASGTAPTIATGVGTSTVVVAVGTDTNTRMYGFLSGSDMR